MNRLLMVFFTLGLVLLSTGCAGESAFPLQARATEGVGPLELPPDIAASKGSFHLRVLPDSYSYGGQAEFTLQVTEQAMSTEVTVMADGEGLKAALLELYYDPQTNYPIGSRSSGALSSGSQAELSLAIVDFPGVVYFGAVMPGLDQADGVSGTLELATFTFMSGPVSAHKQVRTAPKLPSSSIPDLVVDTATGDVSFSYYNTGDYDQNSEVNISDLTRIGIAFGESVVPAQFDPATALSVVDGDNNGEINAADITPIGLNFGNKIDGWALYTGAIADYPADATAGNGSANNLESIPYSPHNGDPAVDRLTYAANTPEVIGSTAEAAWLRPLGSDGEGIASAPYTLGGGPDVTPPVWTAGEAGTGVQSVIPGDGEVTVTWGEATDSQSSPVTYVVYYSAGGTVDFDTAATVEVTASDPPDPFTDQLTTITGLSNETEYAFAVRAKDAADPPNSEANENVLTVTPLDTALLPETITEDMTFAGPVVLMGGNTSQVTCSEDTVLTFMGSLTIEDGATLTGGDGLCDLTIIVHGNFVVDGTIDFNINGTLVGDGDVKSLKLVPQANFSSGPNSVISSEGNLYIVDDLDDLVTPVDAADDVENGSFEEFPFTLMPLPDAAAAGKAPTAVGKTTSATQYYGPWWTWNPRGNWGKVPVPPKNVKRIILRIFQRRGHTEVTNFNLEGPDGAAGTDDQNANCDAEGGDGDDNKWMLRWHATRSITFDNVTLKFGDGGRGGDASTPGDCCPATASGGDGGDSNNKFRITAGNLITINNSLNMNPGNGGRGGHASATARDGLDGCPGEDGCDATAGGGTGGNVPRWGVRISGAVFGAANVALGQAEGGRGGDADAFAGNGGNGLPCCDGGNGGIADALGGTGGNAHYTNGGSAATGGGAKAGDGGDALAFGGDGGDGGDCYKAQAGNGGNGGDASAAGGDPGTTSGDAPQVPGVEGGASAFGGNGGDGGDGFPPGGGGTEGLALALGTPSVEEDGLPGLDGAEWPVGGIVIWCIKLDDFVPPGPPGPIPSGHTGMCTLVDMSTQLPVGQAPFTFFGPADTTFWNRLPDETITIQFFNAPANENPTGLYIDMQNLQIEGPQGPLMGGYVQINMAQPITPSTEPLGTFGFYTPPETVYGEVDIPLVELGAGPVEVSVELAPPVPSAVCAVTVNPNSIVELIDDIYIFDP